MNIEAMLANPGVYRVSIPPIPIRHASGGSYCLVEVDTDGTAYQLTPNRVRDGVLSREGWSPDAFATRDDGSDSSNSPTASNDPKDDGLAKNL